MGDQKQSRALQKELARTCGRVEKHCIPLQSLLTRCTNRDLSPVIRDRIDQLAGSINVIQVALHQIKNDTYRRGGGASERLGRQVVDRMRANDRNVASAQADATARPSARPSLQCSKSEFSFPAVLDLISRQVKTGMLIARLPEELITLSILHGEIVRISSNKPQHNERLGEILMEHCNVPWMKFTTFVEAHKQERSLLGMALVKEGIVEQKDLTSALIEQMQRRFDRILEATKCQFEFFPGKVSSDTGLNIAISELMFDADDNSAKMNPQEPSSDPSESPPTPENGGVRATPPSLHRRKSF